MAPDAKAPRTLPQPPWLSRRGRRRLLAALALTLLAGALVPVAAYRHRCAVAGADLEAALAETDRLDPGWRWEDIQAKRATVPDKENGALHALAVAKQLPKDWGASEEVGKPLEDLRSDRRLNEQQPQ